MKQIEENCTKVSFVQFKRELARYFQSSVLPTEDTVCSWENNNNKKRNQLERNQTRLLSYMIQKIYLFTNHGLLVFSNLK